MFKLINKAFTETYRMLKTLTDMELFSAEEKILLWELTRALGQVHCMFLARQNEDIASALAFLLEQEEEVAAMVQLLETERLPKAKKNSIH